MEQVYFVIKLMPNVPSWCDKKNNIYLTRPNKMSKRLKADCDMTAINKGVKAKLIKLEEHKEVIAKPVKKAVKKQNKKIAEKQIVDKDPINKDMDSPIIEEKPVVEVIEQDKENK